MHGWKKKTYYQTMPLEAVGHLNYPLSIFQTDFTISFGKPFLFVLTVPQPFISLLYCVRYSHGLV